jgi:hypothetical protein
MPDLGDELRRLAEQAGRETRPLPPDEVMRRGNCRRRGRIVRDAAAVVTVAGAVAAGVVLSGITGGGHTVPERPASHSQPPASKSARPVTHTPVPFTATPRPVPTGSRLPPTPVPAGAATRVPASAATPVPRLPGSG